MGVEGVGHSVCMAIIYARERFAPQVQLDLPLGFAACLSKNPAGVSIRICNPINEFLFNICGRRILTKVVYLFNRIANSYTHSSRITNPAEPRRVSENSMGVLKITP